jgi:hypothetical protein
MKWCNVALEAQFPDICFSSVAGRLFDVLPVSSRSSRTVLRDSSSCEADQVAQTIRTNPVNANRDFGNSSYKGKAAGGDRQRSTIVRIIGTEGALANVGTASASTSLHLMGVAAGLPNLTTQRSEPAA